MLTKCFGSWDYVAVLLRRLLCVLRHFGNYCAIAIMLKEVSVFNYKRIYMYRHRLFCFGGIVTQAYQEATIWLRLLHVLHLPWDLCRFSLIFQMPPYHPLYSRHNPYYFLNHFNFDTCCYFQAKHAAAPPVSHQLFSLFNQRCQLKFYEFCFYIFCF